tara:strand:- start:536 stop:967 length:432 start_codon:yes stop_codon:yes gene_type:complete
MTDQFSTSSIQVKSAGTKANPVYSVESQASYVSAAMFDTSDEKGVRDGAMGLYPLLNTIQRYGVNKMAYIGNYTIGSKDEFIPVLERLIAELFKIYGDELSVLLHIDSDDIDVLNNALEFGNFIVDGSLSNGARGLAAYSLNL